MYIYWCLYVWNNSFKRNIIAKNLGHTMRHIHNLFLVACTLFLTACVPHIHKQTAIKNSEIKDELEKSLISTMSNKSKLKTDWYKAYGDPQLDKIVEYALKSAPSMKSIEARYAQANSIIKSAQAGNLPNISVNAAVSRERYSENYIFPPPLGGGTESLYQTGLMLNYDFDFNNARGSKILSAKYSAMAQKAYIDEMRLALSSAICKRYLSWDYDEKRVQILSESKNDLLQELSILDAMFQQGLIDATALNTKKAELSALKQKIYALKRSIESKKESISVLGGFLPSYTETLRVPKIKENFQVPLPKEIYLDLIAHRADVAVKKYIVLSKGQNIENAKAQFYPNVSLSGLVSFISFDADKLFTHSSYAPMAGAAFSLPIFDAGAREANLQMNVSDYNSSVNDYNNAIIKATNEVVGVLKRSKLIESQIGFHEEDLDAKSSNEKIARKKYSAGLTNKLPYLNAKVSTNSGKLTEIDLSEEKAILQLSLIKALGGGYKEEEIDANR